MSNLYYRMAQRSDTASNWAQENPVLLTGEIGYETDTNKVKIGDGSTAWNTLPYFTSGGGSVSWDDITGKPTIPAPANDGTLSITIDGVTHKFTANQKEDIDIVFTTGGGGAIYNSGNGVNVDNDNHTISADTNVMATIQYVNEKIGEINSVLSSI